MDWDFVAKYAPMYVRAAGLTLRIAAVGIALSLAVGILCCAARRFRVPGLAQIAGGYIELARNTPLLIQLFFLYFGLPKVGVVLGAESCAVIGLTFLGGAYMAEALRSGLGVTLELSLISIALSILLGMLVGAAMTRRHPLPRFHAAGDSGDFEVTSGRTTAMN